MLLLQFTWNLLGMMNNCVYRVKIHPEALPGGGFGLRFEHPTVAGPTPGGWMNRAEGAGAKPQQVGGWEALQAKSCKAKAWKAAI